MRKRFLPLATLTVLLLLTGCLGSAFGQNFGRLTGRVHRGDVVLPYLVVKLKTPSRAIVNGALTDEQGRFDFKVLEAGEYRIIVDFDGQSIERSVWVQPGKTVHKDFDEADFRKRLAPRTIITT